jgi:glycosyltransferase involved in cell wall biosynthesis
MRIAVWHNLPSGGGKRALYEHVKGLTERGHYVESWRPPLHEDDYLPLSDLVRESVVPLDMTEIPAKGRVQSLLRQNRQLKANLAAIDQHCRNCAEEINKGNFDVLFAGSCYYYRTSPIAKYVRLPSVAYLGEPFRGLYEASPDPPWGLDPRFKSWRWSIPLLRAFVADQVRVHSMRRQVLAEVENAGAFSQLLVNSFYSRESVLRAYGIESKVCYLGLDSAKFTPSADQKLPFLVGLGAIYHWKRVDRSIRAVSKVDKAIRPKLVWIGNFEDVSYKDQMRRLAQELDVDVEFHLRLSDEETIKFLRQATAMIYTPYLEPFGLAPLEANACGTTVIGVAEAGIRESIVDGKNGFLATSDDPEVLGELITNVISDPALAVREGVKARAHVEKEWSAAEGIHLLESILLQAASDRHQSPNLDL